VARRYHVTLPQFVNYAVHPSIFILTHLYSWSKHYFFFIDTPPTEIYTLSLHDALPICPWARLRSATSRMGRSMFASGRRCAGPRDRKSTRLNSSHVKISYAVFCLKKKKKISRRK